MEKLSVNQPKVRLNVLIACEESQTECAAFRALGHNAFSCDIQPCLRKGHKEWHILGDVTPYLKGVVAFTTMDGSFNEVPRWDLIVAHPPCTYLCKIGAMHLYENPNFYIKKDGEFIHVNYDRLMKMKKARVFFMQCLDARAKYVAVENPCPIKLANLPPASFFACPSWYGSKYTKKTYYWAKNLPPLFAQVINPKAKCLVRSRDGKYRSRTDKELAKAIATQWSDFIINDKTINHGKI